MGYCRLHLFLGFEGVCSLLRNAGSDTCLCDGPVCSLGLLESYEGLLRIAEQYTSVLFLKMFAWCAVTMAIIK